MIILGVNNSVILFQSIPLPYPYQAIEPVQPVYNSHHANIIVPAQTEVVEMVQSAGFISTAISVSTKTSLHTCVLLCFLLKQVQIKSNNHLLTLWWWLTHYQ